MTVFLRDTWTEVEQHDRRFFKNKTFTKSCIYIYFFRSSLEWRERTQKMMENHWIMSSSLPHTHSAFCETTETEMFDVFFSPEFSFSLFRTLWFLNFSLFMLMMIFYAFPPSNWFPSRFCSVLCVVCLWKELMRRQISQENGKLIFTAIADCPVFNKSIWSCAFAGAVRL